MIIIIIVIIIIIIIIINALPVQSYCLGRRRVGGKVRWSVVWRAGRWELLRVVRWDV